ncbi:MAG: hypothetical protein IPK06_02805 [Ignavibacteriae bacterium]|nr:hypothetical protein [Ignavibacteriota bacterium]
MNNSGIHANQNINGSSKIIQYKPKTILDYFNMIRQHWLHVVIIFLIVFALSIGYAISATDIYQAETTLKISPPEGNILEAPLLNELGSGGSQSDRFIANEIHTMNNITIRERVAQVIIDSFKVLGQKDKFSLIFNKNIFNKNSGDLKSDKTIANMLKNIVSINQVPKLDFIEITCESPSPFEASLIANAYADVYREFNLLDNRKQVSRVKEFLENQKQHKFDDLKQPKMIIKFISLKAARLNWTRRLQI